MPAHTEARIHQLCREALTARTLEDTGRIVPDLRSALEEHIQLAKDSLGAQAHALSVLESAALSIWQPCRERQRKEIESAACLL
jgi:hypothetical protein